MHQEMGLDDTQAGGRALQKAMQVLSLFAPDRPELAAAEIARLLGWPKSTAARVVAVMQRSGFVDRDELTGRYRVGIRLAALGALALDGTSLQRIAQPVLEALVQQTGETANVAVLSGREVVNVAVVLSPRPIKHMGWIGRRMPTHATAAGKSLIAWREGPTDTFVSVPLHAYTSRTITNLRALQMELKRVRVSGWSSARGEYEDDLLGVGAPVRDHLRDVIAAVTISAPSFRVPDASTRVIGMQVRAAAEQISTALGYIPAPSANSLAQARR